MSDLIRRLRPRPVVRYKVGSVEEAAKVERAPKGTTHAVSVDDGRPACGTTITLHDFPDLDWETWPWTRKCPDCQDVIDEGAPVSEAAPARRTRVRTNHPCWAEHVGPRRLRSL